MENIINVTRINYVLDFLQKTQSSDVDSLPNELLKTNSQTEPTKFETKPSPRYPRRNRRAPDRYSPQFKLRGEMQVSSNMPSTLHIGNSPDYFPRHTCQSFPTIHSTCISYIHMDSSFPLTHVDLWINIFLSPQLDTFEPGWFDLSPNEFRRAQKNVLCLLSPVIHCFEPGYPLF